MTQDRWPAVDQYLTDLFIPSDPALDGALEASEAAGLPPISVTPNEGKLLQLLARAMGARTILEIGTLGGYSTIWLARALPPGGRVVTLEIESKHAKVARNNFVAAGLSDVIDLRLGPALDLLPRLAAEGLGPFDFIFIDADKPNNPAYLEWAVKLARRGSLILVDNVIRGGAVLEAESDDPNVRGTRSLHAALAADPRLSATVVQTVGSKGYDGFALAYVTGQ